MHDALVDPQRCVRTPRARPRGIRAIALVVQRSGQPVDAPASGTEPARASWPGCFGFASRRPTVCSVANLSAAGRIERPTATGRDVRYTLTATGRRRAVQVQAQRLDAVNGLLAVLSTQPRGARRSRGPDSGGCDRAPAGSAIGCRRSARVPLGLRDRRRGVRRHRRDGLNGAHLGRGGGAHQRRRPHPHARVHRSDRLGRSATRRRPASRCARRSGITNARSTSPAMCSGSPSSGR